MKELEILHIQQQKVAFPWHYHETFCISLIHQGVEALQLPHKLLHTGAGQISITNPYEIHANPLVDHPVKHTFTTLYCSPTIVDDLLEQQNTQFAHQQGGRLHLHQAFNNLLVLEKLATPQQLKQALKIFLKLLKNRPALVPNEDGFSEQWRQLLNYIDTHLEEKLSLEELAQQVYMDKYHFAKLFKKRIGLSPIHYVLMKKVFRAKSLIVDSTNFTALAYTFNFADQAHFSKHFKRFIGLSPSHYQKQLKN